MTPSSNTSDIYNDLIECPIGLFYKCACYINDTLSRNVGSFDNEYDGFGLPIGSMVETHYTIDNFNAWFTTDEDKLSYKNYIDYVQDMYLQSSIQNLFENNAEAINPEKIILDVPSVNHYYDLHSYYNESQNDSLWDTKTGRLNHYYLSNTLYTSSTLNSLRNNLFDKSITFGLSDYIGLNENTERDIFIRFYPNERGRIEVNLNLEGSPVYPTKFNSTYGNAVNFNPQEAWINSLGNQSLRFLGRSLRGDDLIYSSYFEDIQSTSQMMSAYNQLIGEQSYLNKVVQNYSSPYIDTNSPIARWRYDINGTANSTVDKRVQKTYAEAEFTGNLGDISIPQNNTVEGSFNEGIAHGIFSSNISDSNVADLLAKTNQAFKEGSYRTLISRFHTSDVDETNRKESQSAISSRYGMSHGRNLLKGYETVENGYVNPYCRVWTYHYQYSRLQDAIRPISDDGGQVYTQKDLSIMALTNWKYMASQFTESFDDASDGRSRLGKYTVLNKNGMVNIAPTNDEEDAVEIKNCMFSIENLAWKDFRDGEYGLSPEQRGSMGGRIMWFPPYDLKFNEQVKVNWNENSFIGRGENVYTYMNTMRTGNLSFKMIVDHPSIIDYFQKDGEDGDFSDDVDMTDSKEQQLLRFFAGCDLLVAEPNQVDNQGSIDNIPQLPKQTEEEAPEVPTETVTTDAQIIFYVFYPNNYSGVDDNPGSGTVSAMHYLANGLGTQLAVQSDTGKVTEFAPPYTMYSGGNGGYEVGMNGVSIVSDEIIRDTSKTDLPVLNGTKSGRKYTTLDGIELCTQYVQPNNFNGTSEWYYRVDKRYQGQKLLKGNYVDNISYGLNEYGGIGIVKSKFLTSNNASEYENTYSFIDVFCALDSDMYSLMQQRSIVHEDSYKKLKNLFDTYKIKSIQGGGMASSHGYENLNNSLNQDRYNSVVKWLKTYKIFDGVPNEGNNVDIGDVTTGLTKTSSINDVNAKLFRSAKVIINLQKEEVVTLQETAQDSGSVNMGDSGVTYSTKYGDVHVPKNMIESINSNYTTPEARQKAVEQMVLSNPYQFFDKRTPEFDEALKAWQKAAKGAQEEIDKYDAIQSSMQRYDNEANFFKTLPITAPFLHNMLKEKIKYFDPAFHSISPEGFNARLTFLQQCCRQGSTYSANENGMNTGNATNLAFGTPPICVLRVGDFYCTKIVIDNINIDYELWDLNPEGIGVQPMIADIQISFTFLGGQDLSNPIPRLQNALSFNYYKNTSVYDNRAEMAIYDKDNNGTLVQFRGVKH